MKLFKFIKDCNKCNEKLRQSREENADLEEQISAKDKWIAELLQQIDELENEAWL